MADQLRGCYPVLATPFTPDGEKVENGNLRSPDGPGLGVELDLNEVSKHPYRRGSWLPLFKQDWERGE